MRPKMTLFTFVSTGAAFAPPDGAIGATAATGVPTEVITAGAAVGAATAAAGATGAAGSAVVPELDVEVTSSSPLEHATPITNKKASITNSAGIRPRLELSIVPSPRLMLSRISVRSAV